jgi:hypothetical protein
MKNECNKCCGTGILLDCKHVMGGVCFSCGGTGVRHTRKRAKVVTDCFTVECEGVNYPSFKTESEALEFADDVKCMHLEAVKVIKKQTFTYKFDTAIA